MRETKVLFSFVQLNKHNWLFLAGGKPVKDNVLAAVLMTPGWFGTFMEELGFGENAKPPGKVEIRIRGLP